jgi:hypothetical protein
MDRDSPNQWLKLWEPLIRTAARSLTIVVSMLLVGCSMTVPAEKVYGTYVASYPFGTDTITLSRDGSFVQRVAIKQEQPMTVHGTWDFDRKESRANLYGALVVADGFDHLRKDWRTVTTGIVSLDVEKHWFRVMMASASTYPYIKQ